MPLNQLSMCNPTSSMIEDMLARVIKMVEYVDEMVKELKGDVLDLTQIVSSH